MRKLNKILLVSTLASSVLLAGCGRNDFNVEATQVAYLYQDDINSSVRYESGSAYFRQYPFTNNHKLLKVDYGVATRTFESTYTLPAKQKISVSVSAEVMIRLKKSEGNLKFSDDELVKFYANNIPAERISPRSYIGTINANSVYDRLMNENEDKAFRSVFTDVTTYPNFDTLESSIIDIQERIKEELTKQASNANIEIVGVRINDIPVPEAIQEARNDALRLDQNLSNQEKSLEMRAKLAAKEQAIEVREALNDVTVDMIASQTDKGYQITKAIKLAAKNGSPMNISFTPDFMEYIEKSGVKDKTQMAENKALYNKLKKMTNDEMIEYFGQ